MLLIVGLLDDNKFCYCFALYFIPCRMRKTYAEVQVVFILGMLALDYFVSKQIQTACFLPIHTSIEVCNWLQTNCKLLRGKQQSRPTQVYNPSFNLLLYIFLLKRIEFSNDLLVHCKYKKSIYRNFEKINPVPIK